MVSLTTGRNTVTLFKDNIFIKLDHSNWHTKCFLREKIQVSFFKFRSTKGKNTMRWFRISPKEPSSLPSQKKYCTEMVLQTFQMWDRKHTKKERKYSVITFVSIILTSRQSFRSPVWFDHTSVARYSLLSVEGDRRHPTASQSHL